MAGQRTRPQIDPELKSRFEEERSTLLRDLGARLRSRRALLKYSQEQVVKKLQRDGVDIQRTTYAKYEVGGVEPNATMIVKLAKALGTTPGYLLGDEEGISNRDMASWWVQRMASLRGSVPPEQRDRWSQFIMDFVTSSANYERGNYTPDTAVLEGR